MRIALLGPLEAYDENGAPIEIGGTRLRMLLARLALEPGRPVPSRVLIDDLWGPEGPADAANALQAQASRLRRALNGAASVDSVAEGYRLSISAGDVDALRFEELAVRGRRDLAAADLERASARLGEALGLWRGAALDDLLEAPYAQAVAIRLEDLRITAMEDRFDAELRLGRHSEVAVDLDAASARHPLRERLAALRMRALYAAGRRAEALGAYEAFRRYPVLLVSALPMAYLSGLNDLVEREIQSARNGPDAWARACTFIVETFVHYDRGEWTAIAGVLTEAVREFESTGDRLWTAMALVGRARTDSVRGDDAGAIAAYERGIVLVSDLGSENEMAASYRLGLATERMRAGDLGGARRELDIVERSAQDSGPYLLEIDVLMSLAELHRRSGELARSEQVLQRVEALARETPFGSAAIDDRVASARLANRLVAGDVEAARGLVRTAVDAAFVLQDIAPAAQWLARLRLLEGDPADAAYLLGMSAVIRGAFDQGDPELRDLVAALIERLGESAYDLAYRRGAEIPRQDALDRLRSTA